MIDAQEFVALLEEKDLVSPEVVAHLRRQIARPGSPISAALLAKWLVDRGHLSRILAQRLLTRAEETSETAKPPAGTRFDWEKEAEAEEELGLAPLDDEIPNVRAREKMPAPRAGAPAKPSSASSPSAKRPEKGLKPSAAPPPGGSLLDETLTPVGPGAPAGMAPLDRLTAESALDAETGGPLAPVGSKKGLFGRRRRRRRDNVWDSPLLLIGGGSLLVLVVLLGVLYWALTRQTGDESLKIADDFYREGSYTKAIAQYDKYLEDFPNHEGVSSARVRRGLARLRQATDFSNDWPEALNVANSVLDEIAQEKDFDTEGRPELVTLLPKIAQGLANQAQAKLDAGLVTKTEEALALVTKYVLASARGTKVDDIEAQLALVRREIARGERLQEAIAQMKKAVDENRTAEAYEIRAALLKEYPGLADNEQLHEAVLAVSQAQLPEVKPVEKPRRAEAAELPVSTVATLALVRRQTSAAPPGSEGHVIFVLARGAAYGLNAASGEILWRRPVGFAADGRTPAFPPTAIADQPESDAIMVDAGRNEVLRVEAATGRPRWRYAVGERFDAPPVVAGNRLLVATRSGHLVWIDLETGDSPGYVELPQELRVAPTVDLRRSMMYQVAEHSNLFVISLADGEPKQIVYLGHTPGSVTVSPVIVNRYLIVAENDGVESATLRVLSLEADKEDQPPVRVVESVALQGHVDSPPQVSGDRVLVATDKGDLAAFEISATDAEKPLARVAEGKAANEQGDADANAAEGMVRFPLMRGGQVWMADRQLTQYDLHPSQGRLQPKGVRDEGSVTLQPLVAIGQTVFHVRSKLGLPGVLVSAVGADRDDPYWEVHLAAPLATEPIVDAQSGQVTAVTMTGAVFQIGADRFQLGASDLEKGAVTDQPSVALAQAEVREPVTDVVRLQDRLLAIAPGTRAAQLFVFDPQEANRFRRIYLASPLAGHLAAFSGGLLAPSGIGQVFFLDPRSGDPRTEPFQPPLKSGGQVSWSRPALVGENELLVAEGANGLYRVGVKDQPKPHLALLAQVDLAEPLASPVAVLDKVAYAVDAAGSLVAFELPNLTASQPRPLGARSAWGPGRVGDQVLLATDDRQLYCLDAAQKTVWQIPLPYGPLAGAPLNTQAGYVLAGAEGVIWRVDPATGKELAKVEIGAPLGTGPVPFGDGLLVGGHDGCLYKAQMP